MVQVNFTQEEQGDLVNKIVDEFIDELYKHQFELVTYEKEDKFEEADIVRLTIDRLIEFTNQVLLSWTGADIKDGLLKESDYVRTQIQENYTKITAAIDEQNNTFDAVQ